MRCFGVQVFNEQITNKVEQFSNFQAATELGDRKVTVGGLLRNPGY